MIIGKIEKEFLKIKRHHEKLCNGNKEQEKQKKQEKLL